MSSRINDITGVILAGGRSVRFGTNKAFALYQGKPVIERVIDVMQGLFADLMLVTNTPEEYTRYTLPIFSDLEPYQGPMGGIVTAFHFTPNDQLFVVGCDMPLLNPRVILEVIAKGTGFDAAVPIHDDTREYLMALYSRRLLTRMACCLSEGKLSLDPFCRRLTNITWVPVSGDSWFNLNTKKDLESLEKRNAD